MSELIYKIIYRCKTCRRRSSTVKELGSECFSCRAKTCLICGNELTVFESRPGPRKAFCSKYCKQNTIRTIQLIKAMQSRYYDPIFQAKQLGIIDIITSYRRVSKIVKEIKFNA